MELFNQVLQKFIKSSSYSFVTANTDRCAFVYDAFRWGVEQGFLIEADGDDFAEYFGV